MVKRNIDEQSNAKRMNSTKNGKFDIDDSSLLDAINSSTNGNAFPHKTSTMNATIQLNGTQPIGNISINSIYKKSLNAETIVFLLIFGICTIIYSSKYKLCYCDG